MTTTAATIAITMTSNIVSQGTTKIFMASSSHYTTFPIMTTEPDKTEKMTTAEPPTTDMLTSHNNIDVTSEPPTIQTTFATILSTGEIVLSTTSIGMTTTTATIAITMTPNIVSQGTTEILMAASSHYTTLPMMTTEPGKTEKMTTAKPATTDMLTSHSNIDVTSELSTIQATFATILSTGEIGITLLPLSVSVEHMDQIRRTSSIAITTTTATIAITMTPNIVSQGTTEILMAASSDYTTFRMVATEADKTEKITTAELPTTDMLTSHINIDVTSELPTIQTTFATILSTVLSTSSIAMTTTTTATIAITMTPNIVSQGTTEILMASSSHYTTFPMMTTEPDKTEKMTTAEPPTADMLTSHINIDVTSELSTIQTTFPTILSTVLNASSIAMTTTTATIAITMTPNIASEGTTEILMAASSHYTTFRMMTTEPDKTEKMTTGEVATTDMLTSRINIGVTSELPTDQTIFPTILSTGEIGITLLLPLSV
ncbi:unnamed protein product [Rotaria sp. Silwood1]|nr:unnamed protein product [Rotaria sp. Silwood1]